MFDFGKEIFYVISSWPYHMLLELIALCDMQLTSA